MKDSEQIKTEKNDWLARQDSLAEKAALSVLLVEGHQPPALAVSNNNSICRVVQSSETHAERCEPYCGSAFAKVMEQGKPIQYRCHAGLYCVATPLPAERPLVAITGRAFVQTSDYRELTERVYAGDWQNLPEDELFENVILAGSVEDIEQLSARLQNLNDDERAALEEIAGKPVGEVVEENAVLEENDLHKEIEHLPEITKHFLESAQEEEVYPEVTPEIKLSTESDNLLEIGEEKPPSPKEIKVDAAEAPVRDEIQPEILKFEDSAETDLPELVANGAMTNPVEWQQFTENLLQSNYQTAVGDSLEFLATQCNFDSLGWLERSENSLKAAIVTGNLRQQTVKINLPQNEEMMREAARNETSLPLERKSTGVRQTIELFPLIFDEEIRAAIIVGEALASDEVRRRVARFCLQLALPLEFLRLREEIGKRARLQSALRKFNETLQAADSENYLETLMVNSAELVGSQRSSLLI
ncbi:MAG TPA: PocR ligand-binding domain-containing protein, partial [Pyrinomonadaceae bacterium]|nr:PocR ligand-binding domain-containing protein [Pyrinomonadaceae bacterium]